MRRKQPQHHQHEAAAAVSGSTDGAVFDHSEVSSFSGGPVLGHPAAALGGGNPAFPSNHRGGSFPAAGGPQLLAEVDGRLRDSHKGKKGGFKEWKRRVGELAIQKIGLVTPSNDANTGDIGKPLQSFAQMRDGLKDIQAQVRNYVLATEGLFGAAHNMTFLFAPLSGETAKQLKLSLCRVAVQDAMIRGLSEYLEAPLKAVLDFCDGIDTLAKRRIELLLDYDHHKRKHDALAARLESGKGDKEEEARVRSVKFNTSTENLKDCTMHILAQVAALAKVEPQLKESLFKGLAACQIFYCQASLSAFEVDSVQSADMQDYIVSLQRAASTLEQSMPLPPLGEHVTYLQNALAAAVAEVRGEGETGEVFGRPLSDFEDTPPLLLECMGFLDAQGLYVPGLFRVPGNTETIRDLKARFDAGEHVEFDEKIHNVNEVATLLKMYFRELPDPVFPTAHYHTMLEASGKGQPEFVETARLCVGQFPRINFTCLRLLFAFLYRVSLCSGDNKMTTENLGIVFAPNLLRAPNATDMNVMDLQSCINVVRRMIESASDIFPNLWEGYPAASS
ncbi:unnamed protein product [Ascophyllum nodosum]